MTLLLAATGGVREVRFIERKKCSELKVSLQTQKPPTLVQNNGTYRQGYFRTLKR